MPLAWVFLRHSDRVEIELVFVALREPQNRLVTTTKSAASMNSVAECPDDSVS
jgi:hypothetical protein